MVLRRSGAGGPGKRLRVRDAESIADRSARWFASDRKAETRNRNRINGMGIRFNRIKCGFSPRS